LMRQRVFRCETWYKAFPGIPGHTTHALPSSSVGHTVAKEGFKDREERNI